jgi:glycosyltransferase involved in cell wall biosynthesis
MNTEFNIKPKPIADQSWPVGTVPKVSILCATYNHEQYLREALDSFLMQETTFLVEIVVRDDCSTDSTTRIVREYESKYPQIFRPIYEVENQYVQGIRPTIVMIEYARGELVALCEGDDYWTRRDKLQQQVELLEATPDSFMCVAKTRVDYEDSDEASIIYEGVPKKTLEFEDFFRGCYLHTSSYLMRSSKELAEKWAKHIRLSDTAWRYIYSDLGPVVFYPEVVSVYRVTGEGVWTSLNLETRLAEEVELHESFVRHFYSKYRKCFSERLLRQSISGIALCRQNKMWGRMSKYLGHFLRCGLRHPIIAFGVVMKRVNSKRSCFFGSV